MIGGIPNCHQGMHPTGRKVILDFFAIVKDYATLPGIMVDLRTGDWLDE